MPDLVGSMKKAALEAVEATKPVAVFFGTVISASPLKIDVEQKLTLSIEQLILSKNVTDHQTWFSFDNPDIKQRISIFNKPEDEPVIKPTIPPPIVQTTTDIQFVNTNYKVGANLPDDGMENKEEGSQPTKHVITHYNHLHIGERVIILRMQGGQKFIVLDRVGL